MRSPRAAAPPASLVTRMRRHLLEAAAIDFLVAWRNLYRQRRRSIAAAVAVIFGTMALILAAGFIQWIFWAMREATIHSGLGHVQVVRAGYIEHGTADPFGYLLPEDSASRTLIEAVPHVIRVAPRLRFTGLISLGDSTLSFLGQGFDIRQEAGMNDSTILESGGPLSDTDRTGILVGRGLARNLGAKVGDKVALLSTRRDGSLNGVDATIRGIFTTSSSAYDDVAVNAPYRLANSLVQAGGASTWVVYLDRTGNTPWVTQALQKRLTRDLQVIPWYEAADFYNKTVTLFSRQVLVMKIIIAVVVILSISNTMMTNVMERTNEIATTMALGLRRGRVLSRFLLEGILIGLIGGLIGLGLGYALAAGISWVGIPMPPPPGMARGFVGQVLVTEDLAWNALSVAGVTAFLASLYPAWRASRMVIADALRQGR